jgi:hypothetical protein
MSEQTPWAVHLQWCKTRALQYVEAGDPEQAIASMSSDLRKHPEAPNSEVISHLTMSALLGPKDPGTIRRWIEGWN